jgi:hypothetical protein
LDLFLIACDHGWEDSAKAALVRFFNWRYRDGRGPSFLLEDLPVWQYRRLGRHTLALAIALNACQDASKGEWIMASRRFSLRKHGCVQLRDSW